MLHRIYIAMIVWWCAAALVTGCGDGDEKPASGLVDNTYQGEPLAVITGTLSVTAPLEQTKNISIGVIWTGPRSYEYVDLDFEGDNEEETGCAFVAPHQTEVVTQSTMDLWPIQSVTYELTSLVEFSVPIYELPPEAARWDLAELGGKGWIAGGIVAAFSDVNGNGIFDRGTPDNLTDRLLSLSYAYSEEDETEYMAQIIFVHNEGDKKFLDELYYDELDLQQGFNLMELINDEVYLRNLDYPIQLSPIREDTVVGSQLMEMQCSEIEYTVEFNAPMPVPTELYWISSHCEAWGTGVYAGEDESEFDGGSGADDGTMEGDEGSMEGGDGAMEDVGGMETDFGAPDDEPLEGLIAADLRAQELHPANPCKIREWHWFACFDDGVEAPDMWMDLCL